MWPVDGYMMYTAVADPGFDLRGVVDFVNGGVENH